MTTLTKKSPARLSSADQAPREEQRPAFGRGHAAGRSARARNGGPIRRLTMAALTPTTSEGQDHGNLGNGHHRSPPTRRAATYASDSGAGPSAWNARAAAIEDRIAACCFTRASARSSFERRRASEAPGMVRRLRGDEERASEDTSQHKGDRPTSGPVIARYSRFARSLPAHVTLCTSGWSMYRCALARTSARTSASVGARRGWAGTPAFGSPMAHLGGLGRRRRCSERDCSENVRVLEAYLGRDAPRLPVGDSLHTTFALVVTEHLGNLCRSAKRLDQRPRRIRFVFTHAHKLNTAFIHLSTPCVQRTV